MENLISNASIILLAVAIICTFVSILTQFTKEIGFLNKIPTMLQVLVTSVITTVVAVIALIQIKGYALTWYIIIAAAVAGVFIAYITAKGWDSLIEIFKRFYKDGSEL